MKGAFSLGKGSFSAWWRTYWVAGLLGLTLLVGILGQYNLLRQIERPFPGFMSYSNLHGGYWTVAENTPPWWSGIRDTGLHYSDRILKLEGYGLGVDQGALFAQAYQENVPVAVTVLREGEEIVLETAVVPFTLAHFLEIKTTHIIIGLGFWLLALTVYATRPDELLNQFVAAAGCLVAINQWLWLRFLFHLEPHPLSIILDFMVVLMYAFFAPVLAHTMVLFPPATKWAYTRSALFLYALTPLFVVILVTRKLFLWQGRAVSVWFSQLEQGVFHAAQLLALVAGLLFLLRLLLLAWRQRRARLPMFQHHILLAGFVLPLLYVVQTIWTSVSGTNFSSWHYLIDWRFVFLAAPLSIAFVIIRYQTFSSSNRMILVVLALSVSALFATVCSAILQQSYPHLVAFANAVPLFLPLFLMMFLFTLAWLFLSLPGGWVGRLLHREARHYGDVKLFGQNLVQKTRLSELPEAIIAALREMNIEQAAIWLWDGETAVFQQTAQSPHWLETLPPQLPASPAIQEHPGQLLRLNTPKHSPPPWLHPLQAHPSIKLVGLLGHGEVIGLLALSTRWDEEIYTDRDLEIMELIVQQTSLFLLTAMQINELRQVPNRIISAQEQERHRIACELHDTTQQFLGRLPFRLAVSQRNISTNPEKSNAILQECLAEISDAAITLRHIRGSLSPSLSEATLSHSLPALVDRFQQQTAVSTTLTLPLPPELDEILGVNGRYALYRLIQQALDNIEAHAQATAVTITLYPQIDKLIFEIVDNGNGFSAKMRQQAETRGSFGIQSMETRITAQGGKFRIHAIPEKGTAISGWLPIHHP